MYTVGVININDKLSDRYINELLDNNYNVLFMEADELLTNMETVDAILLHFHEENEEVLWEICNLVFQIKEKSNAFIWTFSNQIVEINRLVYLKLGVHGNIPAWSTPTELELILHNTLSHYKTSSVDQLVQSESQTAELLTIYERNRSIQINGGTEIGLTKLEYRLLTILCSKKGEILGYEELRNFIWQEEDVESYRARLANLVFYLRKKIEKHADCSEFIQTIWSRGYMLDIEIEHAPAC